VVKNKVFAKEVVELLLEYSGRLDESVARAKKVCSEAEFLAYPQCYRRGDGWHLGSGAHADLRSPS
jgi:hypothetical protein